MLFSVIVLQRSRINLALNSKRVPHNKETLYIDLVNDYDLITNNRIPCRQNPYHDHHIPYDHIRHNEDT
jgi:hypothetical protein